MAAALPAPADAADACRTRACHVRVAKRERHERWRRVTAPYRPWLRSVRACESGGDYRVIDATGTFFGAYQFTLTSWRAVGGWGMPHEAGPLQQDYRAVRLLRVQGAGAWPVCG